MRHPPGSSDPAPRRARRRAATLTAVLALACSSVIVATGPLAASSATAVAPRGVAPQYPVGVFDLNEPSSLAPPTATALPGYQRSFVDDFSQSLSSQWFLFSGVPKGDPSGRFDRYHVAVDHGQLKIGTWRDPRFSNHWTSGGVGLGGMKATYGAYFVRSRQTAPGPDTVELLWPASNRWPPEIDFDEAGQTANAEMWFVHYHSAKDQVIGRTTIDIEHWHTWGVIWTPTAITFTVDGHQWGQVTAAGQIPNVPMTLDLQAQTWCGIKAQPCPTKPSALLVDWVTIYSHL